MQSELKPCAHCGGAAECDSRQAFRAMSSGKIRSRFAIYCTSCNSDMGFCYDDIESSDHDAAIEQTIAAWNTRASAAEITRLTEALRAAEDREKGLREALVKADEPHWFYAEGYEDRCLYGPDDAIDLLDFDAGEYVTEVVTARPCRSIWCAVRVTDDEDADERFTFTEHDSEEAARAALKGPSHDA